MDKRKKWVWFDCFVKKKTKNQTSLTFFIENEKNFKKICLTFIKRLKEQLVNLEIKRIWFTAIMERKNLNGESIKKFVDYLKKKCLGCKKK